MAEFVFNCPYCDISISANDSLCGQPETCPGCGNEICIPIPGLKRGAVYGDFELIEHLGSGASGEVWTAKQLDMERIVALKILLPSLATNSNFIERFKEEVRHSAKLAHPNIVTAYHSGSDKGIYYLAITYVDGKTLAEDIKSGKIYSESDALKIIRCIAQALDYAWNEFNIIHRDIKPENIMIDNKGKAMLLDLGIAKSTVEESGLTLTGTIIGTPYYMSPEQAVGDKKIDFKTDIYSLGATLYHMLTGTVPYQAESAMAIMMKHLNDEFVLPRTHNPSLSKSVEAVIKKMMAKDKDARYQNWPALIEDVDKILKKKKPIHASSEKSSFLFLIVFIFMAILILAAGGYVYINSQKSENSIINPPQAEEVREDSTRKNLPSERKKQDPKKIKSENHELSGAMPTPPIIHLEKKVKRKKKKKIAPQKKTKKKIKKKKTVSANEKSKKEKNAPLIKNKKHIEIEKSNKEKKLKKIENNLGDNALISKVEAKRETESEEPSIDELKTNQASDLELDEDTALMDSPNSFKYVSEHLDRTRNAPEKIDIYWEKINNTKVTWQGNITYYRSNYTNEYEIRVRNKLAKVHGDYNIVLRLTDKKEIKKFETGAKNVIFSGIIYKKIDAKDNGAVTIYLKKVHLKSLF